MTVEDFTIAQINSQPAQLAAAGVQRDPKINWVWCYDFCLANVSNDLIARGLQGDVMGAGFDCNAQNLALIKDDKVQRVCIADPARLGGVGDDRHRQPADAGAAFRRSENSQSGCSTRATSPT